MAKRVINSTRGTVLAQQVDLADNPIRRFFGLMGKTALPDGYGLWIVPCNSIHSFWMRMTFDAVFVDRDNRVLHVIEQMKPWRVSPMIRGARAVLELNPGTVAGTQTTVGDCLAWDGKASR